MQYAPTDVTLPSNKINMNPIRTVRLYDTQAITDIYNWYVLNSVATFETEHVEYEEMKCRIREITYNFPYLVYEENKTVLGFAYAHLWKKRSAYANTWESSVYVATQAHRRGIGTALMLRLIKKCRTARCRALIADITACNQASIKLHQKLGFYQVSHFEKVGYKLGQTLDVVDLELVL